MAKRGGGGEASWARILRKQEAITADYVRSRLDYNPKSGDLIWRNGQCAGAIAGSHDRFGYRIIVFGKVLYRAHRIVWLHVHGRWPVEYLDHVNGVRDDNRIANLREATHAQNIANRAAMGRSKLKGITLHKRSGRWQSQIRMDGRNVYLGCFDTPEEAHEVYMTKARELYGAFARA